MSAETKPMVKATAFTQRACFQIGDGSRKITQFAPGCRRAFFSIAQADGFESTLPGAYVGKPE
jgi:hypothetical protein